MFFSIVLVLHISAGVVGIISGTAAMSFRKGSTRHASAGKIFVASMLIMAASAVYLAIVKDQMRNVLGGIVTFYLLATAWTTAKRHDGETSKFDWVALLIPILIGITLWFTGIQAANRPTRSPDGVPAGMHFFMGSVMLLAAAGDIRMLARGGLFGKQRIVRHLWRMCLGLFIATGSFFLGQQQVFPAFIRRTNLLFVPAVLPLFLLIFWLFRVRLSKAYGAISGSMLRG